MDQLTAFVQDRWLVIVIAIVVLFLVIKIVKTVIKWVIVLVIVAGLFYYGASYDLKELGTNAMATVKDAVASAKEEAVKALAGKDAKFQQNADGSFVVTAGKVKLEGKAGASEVSISIAGAPAIKIPFDEAIKAVIETAKKNG